MEFIPAIDLLDGKSVRLLRGDYAQVSYYEEPSLTLRAFAKAGVNWAHIVDLDAARGGVSNNRMLIERLLAETNMQIEVGGGVRSLADVAALANLGVRRVIVGTKAVSDLKLFGDMCAAYPGVMAAGIDYRRVKEARLCALNGWTDYSDVELMDAISKVIDAGTSAIVLTDISRDGTLEGPDLATLVEVGEITNRHGIDLISSGGVSSVDDLVTIGTSTSTVGSIFGCISGKAVHEGIIDLEEAVRSCRMFE